MKTHEMNSKGYIAVDQNSSRASTQPATLFTRNGIPPPVHNAEDQNGLCAEDWLQPKNGQILSLKPCMSN